MKLLIAILSIITLALAPASGQYSYGSYGEYSHDYGSYYNYDSDVYSFEVEDHEDDDVQIITIDVEVDDGDVILDDVVDDVILEIDSNCYFTRDLTVGSTGSDVVALQNILENGGYLTLPDGVAKGYFGSQTQAALSQFQAANGLSPASGYFGPITRVYMASICTQDNLTPPSQIPFGHAGQIWALAMVEEITVEAYTYIRGQRVRLDSFSEDIDVLNKIEDIDEAIRYEELHFEIDDPRQQINVEAFLEDGGGNELFVSNRSFYLQRYVDDQGQIRYEVPNTSLYFYWRLVGGLEFEVEGLVSATIRGQNGSSNQLDVKDGVISLPEWAFDNPYWNTLELRFADGTLASYDGYGNLVRPEIVELEFGGSWMENVDQATLENGYIRSRNYHYQYEYNPVLEVTLDQYELVGFDLADGSDEWLRPEIIQYATLQDLKDGRGWTSMEYYGQNPTTMLPPGTYYIRCIWPLERPGKG